MNLYARLHKKPTTFRQFTGLTVAARVYDRSRLDLPAGVPGSGDNAYLGTRLRAPTQKPRGRPLTGRRPGTGGWHGDG